MSKVAYKEEREIKGFKCTVVLNSLEIPNNPELVDLNRAWHCGYIVIPVEHPWYEPACDDYNGMDCNVHGGLTYAELCSEGVKIGWDYAHCNDPQIQDAGYRAKVWADVGDMVEQAIAARTLAGEVK